MERRRAANRIAVADLTELLRARGLEPHPDSATNFVLVEVGADADAITASLLAAGVSVQSGTPFGAPTSLRIGAGSAADLELLDAALAAAGFSRPRVLGTVQRGLTHANPGGSGRGLRYPEPRAHGASFRMRTTLKRGVGRGHSGNGNGKMQLPPGPTAPVTIYRQPEPPRRSRSRLALSILGWAFTVVVVCAVGVAGGAYLYTHETVAAVAAHSIDVKATAKKLDIPIAGQPATALVIGYDRRANEAKGAPSRSDTLMLIRADPAGKTISLLSFPRDLRAEIVCPGKATYTTKINAAYANCGSRGTLDTVRKLTGVSVNYLITVNFRGFTQVVDKLGGMWMDVDRRYYNSHSGPTGYATINLQPGYQKLNGSQALDFVRFRHTDSDLYRNARQQSFVRALKDQIHASLSPVQAAEGDQGDDEQHRGRSGRWQGRQRQDGALVRVPRVLVAEGSRLPVADRRARGLRRPDDLAGEHLRSRPRVGQPRRRVAEEGDRGRARREGQDEDPRRQGDVA